MTGQVFWLDVPYSDNSQAKRAGARWDGQERRWYLPPGIDPAGLSQWHPLPDLLPGEDRTFGGGLFVDLVPDSCWFTNVRSCVDRRDWDRLRVMVYRRAGSRCEVCAAVPDDDLGVRLEAHERWEYLPDRLIQRLARLVCLCNHCHEVTHFGFAELRGRQQIAFSHLMQVTGMDPAAATAHIDAAFDLWEARSARAWTLDLTLLTRVGVRLNKPPSPDTRREIAGVI